MADRPLIDRDEILRRSPNATADMIAGVDRLGDSSPTLPNDRLLPASSLEAKPEK